MTVQLEIATFSTCGRRVASLVRQLPCRRVGAALPTMRGREFYGICYDPDDDFRACVAVKEGDEAASFGLHR